MTHSPQILPDTWQPVDYIQPFASWRVQCFVLTRDIHVLGLDLSSLNSGLLIVPHLQTYGWIYPSPWNNIQPHFDKEIHFLVNGHVGHGLMPTDFTGFTVCSITQKQVADRRNDLLEQLWHKLETTSWKVWVLSCRCFIYFFFLFFFLQFVAFCFIYFLFLAALGLFCCTRAFSSCSEQGYSSLQCAGVSLRWLLLLQSTGSRCTGFSSCGSRALEHRLSSCGARTQLLQGMWDLPGPGLEPMSHALAGGFLTTASPGKPALYTLDRGQYVVPSPPWPECIGLGTKE